MIWWNTVYSLDRAKFKIYSQADVHFYTHIYPFFQMEFVILDAAYRQQREEEERVAAAQENRARLRQLRDNSDPFALPDHTFKGMYRLPKDLVNALVNEIRPFLGEGGRVTAIPVELKVNKYSYIRFPCTLNIFSSRSMLHHNCTIKKFFFLFLLGRFSVHCTFSLKVLIKRGWVATMLWA